MNARSSIRDVAVGLVVIAAIAGCSASVSVASDGPGFLAPQKTVDVIFHDGQGIRVGSPVRVAGTGRRERRRSRPGRGRRAAPRRVRISLPANLLEKLPPGREGDHQPGADRHEPCEHRRHRPDPAVLARGRQTIRGVETSFFDPIIEQIGLGPVGAQRPRTHRSARSGRPSTPIGPRLRQILATFQETSRKPQGHERLRSGPAVESTISNVEDLSRRIGASAPKIEATLARLDGITGEAEEILAENRENVRLSLASVRDLTGSLNDVVAKDRVKVEQLLDGLDMTRARADRVLYQADQIAGQVAAILARSRAEIERSVTNVRDATDWGNKLVQKIYTNPFVLSPFYKPSKEDLRVEAAYDTAQVFAKGAQELDDTVKTHRDHASSAQTARAAAADPAASATVLALTGGGWERRRRCWPRSLKTPIDTGRRRR